MRLEDPIADVDHMDVLFDDDVTGEHAVAHPIPQPALRGRGVGPGRAIDVPGQIIGFSADDVAQRSRVDAADQLDKGRQSRIWNPTSRLSLPRARFPISMTRFRAGDIYRHRFFQVHVLARGNDVSRCCGWK